MSDPQPARRVILAEVSLIDGIGTAVRRDAYVAVADGRIVNLGGLDELWARSGDVVYRLPGMIVMPGLIDTHLHLYATGSFGEEIAPPPKHRADSLQLIAVGNLQAHVEVGFTTVRDTGSANAPVWALRYAACHGLFLAPRIVACGKVLTITGGHGTEYGIDMAWECDGAADLVKGVRRQRHEGADFVKVIASRLSPDGRRSIPSWPVEGLAAAVGEAHALGMKVSAHVMGAEAMDVALRAGVDSLEHGWGGTDDVWAHAAEARVFLVPTLSVLYKKEKYEAEGRPPWPPTFDLHFGTLAQRFEECLAAQEAGVPIALGTDAANPGVYHGEGAIEFGLLVRAGLSPLEAIAAGTSRAARLCGIDGEVGSIEAGKLADLLVVRGDPSEDIGILTNPENVVGVMKAGQFVKGERFLAPFREPVGTA